MASPNRIGKDVKTVARAARNRSLANPAFQKVSAKHSVVNANTRTNPTSRCGLNAGAWSPTRNPGNTEPPAPPQDLQYASGDGTAYYTTFEELPL